MGTKFVNDDGEVICQECGESFSDLNLHIHYTHDFNTEEYQSRYPEAPMKAEEWRKKHVEKGKRLHKQGKIPKTKSGSDNPYWKGGKIEKDCLYCGESIKRHPSGFRGQAQFCSNTCEAKYKSENWEGTDKVGNFEGCSHTEEHKEYMSQTLSGGPLVQEMEDNPNWRGGRSFEPYPPEFNAVLKERIRDRCDRRCFLCGVFEEDVGYSLHVHHIDYVKNNLRGYNLVSLCKPCHMKTNSNRVFWRCFFDLKMIGYI